MFSGKAQSPPFYEHDLEEIEGRVETTYTGVQKENVNHLCCQLRNGTPLYRNGWMSLREWARGLPPREQQLKRDLFRLLKAVQVTDEEDEEWQTH